MRYLSVCSGIEAATVAWHPLGWKPAAFAEIEAFPSAVLAHHFPDVPNLGDMTTIEAKDHGAIDLLVGGTPCQAFSIAGLRKGLDDPRGNLALSFVGLVAAARPRWVVWENVPGVLSSNGGRDFGSLVGALAELGYGWAYRVLDAQHFGTPQRRRRVFLVGHSGAGWQRPGAVLFDAPGGGRTAAAGREAQPVVSPTLTARGAGALDDREAYVLERTGRARRLTPREWERLQGFPDGWTAVPWRGRAAPDKTRCKAIGNSMAVPVMRWLGERIAAVDAING